MVLEESISLRPCDKIFLSECQRPCLIIKIFLNQQIFIFKITTTRETPCKYNPALNAYEAVV